MAQEIVGPPTGYDINFSAYMQNQTPQDRMTLDYAADRDEIRTFHQFRRPVLDPLVVGYQYTFITAPELSIDSSTPGLVGAGASDILAHNRKVLKIDGTSIYTEDMVADLCGRRTFVPIFTNRSVSAIASDEVLSTMDYGETWNKYKILIGTSAKESRIGGSLSINMMEDQDLNLLKRHKLWLDYIEKAFLGDVICGGVVLSDDLLSNTSRTIDYAVSIYQFSTLPDGETLTHWCRYTGCFPTKLPWSEFTVEDGSTDVKKNIPFEYQFAYKEDMSVHVLRDFNAVVTSSSPFPNSELFHSGADVRIGAVSDTNPRIVVDRQDSSVKRFKLLFPTLT